MKPGTINGATLDRDQQRHVMDWLKSNGVRHYIPEDARIVITGNWIVTPTLDIGRTYNPRYGYDPKTSTLNVKARRYRIRIGPLRIPPRRMTKSELRSAAHKADIEATLALCHHNGYHEGCDACEFRKGVVVEHLQRVTSVTMWCLSGVHTDCGCEDDA